MFDLGIAKRINVTVVELDDERWWIVRRVDRDDTRETR